MIYIWRSSSKRENFLTAVGLNAGPCPGEWTIKANYGTTQRSQASPKKCKIILKHFQRWLISLSSSFWWSYNFHKIMILSITAMQIEKGYINIINIKPIYQHTIIFRHLHNKMRIEENCFMVFYYKTNQSIFTNWIKFFDHVKFQCSLKVKGHWHSSNKSSKYSRTKFENFNFYREASVWWPIYHPRSRDGISGSVMDCSNLSLWNVSAISERTAPEDTVSC